jgi:hypothetical protein
MSITFEIALNSDCVCNLHKARNFGAAVRIGPDTAAQQRKIAMARNCTTDRLTAIPSSKFRLIRAAESAMVSEVIVPI